MAASEPKEPTSALDETKTTALSTHVDYGDYEGAGFENQDSSDYKIPFLVVLQPMSPELEENDKAKSGMILNKVTGDLFDSKDGIRFVPCYTQHVYVEWIPRAAGGGIAGTHELDSEAAAMARAAGPVGKFEMENGNELIETFYVYGVQELENGSSAQAVIAFTSTKIKKYKAWMTKARTIQIRLEDGRKINPPLFAHVYSLKTVKEKNAKGDFWNWDVSFSAEKAEDCRLTPKDSLFQEAAETLNLIRSGAATADFSSDAKDGEQPGGEKTVKDGKAPF